MPKTLPPTRRRPPARGPTTRHFTRRSYTTNKPAADAKGLSNPYHQEAAGHLKTVRDLMRFATTKMREHKVQYGTTHLPQCGDWADQSFPGQGSTNAYDDAFWLVYGTLKLPMNTETPGIFFDANLTPKEIEKGAAGSDDLFLCS